MDKVMKQNETPSASTGGGFRFTRINKAMIALDQSNSFRVYLAITTRMAEEARQIHNTTPLASAALGRVLTAAGIMGLMQKSDSDKLTVQFKGDGPATEILATANGTGRVKGYIANPDVDLPLKDVGKLDVGGSLGIGTVTVIKDLGLKEPYIGRIDLVSGEIADDLTAYFFVSEQQSSSVALGVKIETDCSVGAAAGMIIQMLPQSDPSSVDYLEEMLKTMKPLSTLAEEATAEAAAQAGVVISEEGLACKALDILLEKIYGEMPEEYRPRKLEYRDIGWECDCSRERLERVLLSVGRKELSQIIEEDGQAELTCQFCEKKYFFNKEELEALLQECRK